MFPHLEKHLPVDQNEFAFRSATGCIDAIPVLKETVMYCNFKCFDVCSTWADLSRAYNRTNTSFLCDKMREVCLPVQVIAFIDFMDKTHLSVHLVEDSWLRNGML